MHVSLDIAVLSCQQRLGEQNAERRRGRRGYAEPLIPVYGWRGILTEHSGGLQLVG